MVLKEDRFTCERHFGKALGIHLFIAFLAISTYHVFCHVILNRIILELKFPLH